MGELFLSACVSDLSVCIVFCFCYSAYIIGNNFIPQDNRTYVNEVARVRQKVIMIISINNTISKYLIFKCLFHVGFGVSVTRDELIARHVKMFK